MVAPFTLICLAIATLFVAALPVALYWRLRGPTALGRRYAIAGVAVFALFAMVIERGLNMYLLGRNPATATWLAMNPAAFVVYGALIAGVCEEGGRWLGMRWLIKRNGAANAPDSDGPALSYGLGHGGAEAWLVGVLVQVQWIVYALLASYGKLDPGMTNLPDETVMQIHLLLTTLSVPMALIFALERTSALVFQIALSVLMWRGLRAGWRGILPLAIAVHALIDAPAALFQAGKLPLMAVDGAYALAAVAVAGVLIRIFRRPSQGGTSAAAGQA
ncbi:YhfC family intramembrane metalloprotease [Trinickia terrae]|uniref:YhfC family intramembrane metalloprotease n=1 Tax=Trinickia terrae TaxID=2571161 RepID=A0A4U1I9Y7_9BURK|nr:YhfC family intramembrane metalloprotease [Trinickia terrae]TKC90292.1 YhfC family intramembrane metalloprotease [Trinickia terrae]